MTFYKWFHIYSFRQLILILFTKLNAQRWTSPTIPPFFQISFQKQSFRRWKKSSNNFRINFHLIKITFAWFSKLQQLLLQQKKCLQNTELHRMFEILLTLCYIWIIYKEKHPSINVVSPSGSKRCRCRLSVRVHNMVQVFSTMCKFVVQTHSLHISENLATTPQPAPK